MDLEGATSLQLLTPAIAASSALCLFCHVQIALNNAGKVVCYKLVNADTLLCCIFCIMPLVCCVQIALDNAGKLMDLVAAGESSSSSYGAIAQQLAEEYQKAGLSDVANFIKAASWKS
jgi:hypothetical protein